CTRRARSHGQHTERLLAPRDRDAHAAGDREAGYERRGREPGFLFVVFDDDGFGRGQCVAGLRVGAAGDRDVVVRVVLPADRGAQTKRFDPRDQLEDVAVGYLKDAGDGRDRLTHEGGRLGARERPVAEGGDHGLLTGANPRLVGSRGAPGGVVVQRWRVLGAPMGDSAPSPQALFPFNAHEPGVLDAERLLSGPFTRPGLYALVAWGDREGRAPAV